MTRVPGGHEQKCTQCGSSLIDAEWDEQVSAEEIQYLWRCEGCGNEFVTLAACAEKPASETEITKPFFTSLVVE
jgi:ribosomal protein L37AE/L43A